MFSPVEWLEPTGTDSGSLESQQKVASLSEEQEDDGDSAPSRPATHPLHSFPNQPVVFIRVLLMTSAPLDTGQGAESFLILDGTWQEAVHLSGRLPVHSMFPSSLQLLPLWIYGVGRWLVKRGGNHSYLHLSATAVCHQGGCWGHSLGWAERKEVRKDMLGKFPDKISNSPNVTYKEKTCVVMCLFPVCRADLGLAGHLPGWCPARWLPLSACLPQPCVCVEKRTSSVRFALSAS